MDRNGFKTKSEIMRDVRAGKKGDTVAVLYRLPKRLRDAVERVADLRGTTKSEVVRQALLNSLPEKLWK